MDGEELYISSGTWSLLGAKIHEPITTTESMKANYTNEGGVGYIRYLKNIMGMWLVNRLRDELCPEKEAKRFGGLPEKEKKFNGKLWSSNESDATEPPTETCTLHAVPTAPTTPTTKSVKVPSVIGETLSSARSKLQKLNLKVEVSYSKDESKEDGVVLKQNITAGTEIDENSTVKLTVNKKDSEDENTNTNTNTNINTTD